jgi:APA family basic amino acid/polyamine antiporter
VSAASPEQPAGARENVIPRHIGLNSAILLVVGNVIGSGIFLTSGLIARDLPSTGGLLAAWAIGGVISLLGALSYAEMGAAYPRSGGLYAYLAEAYGSMIAFLFGWASLTIILTGQIAGIAIGFAEYLAVFLPAASNSSVIASYTLPGFGLRTISGGQVVATVMILGLCWINIAALGGSRGFAVVLTAAKVLVLALIAVLALTAGNPVPAITFEMPQSQGFIAALALAMIPVLWTFEGWANLNLAGGEVKNPRRNLPLALVLGIGAVTFIYILVNLAYLSALSIEEMSGVVRIGEAAASKLGGSMGAGVFSAIALLSTAGCNAAMLFVSARMLYAMSRDGLFLPSAGKVHPKFGTPANAVMMMGGWAILLAVSGSYEQLYTFVMVGVALFSTLAGVAVIVLRLRKPDVERPYKTPGYPLVPLLFAGVMGLLGINTMFVKPVESMIGIGLILTGLPLYFWFRKRQARAGQAPLSPDTVAQNV